MVTYLSIDMENIMDENLLIWRILWMHVYRYENIMDAYQSIWIILWMHIY
jgi:hypothetical protein